MIGKSKEWNIVKYERHNSVYKDGDMEREENINNNINIC